MQEGSRGEAVADGEKRTGEAKRERPTLSLIMNSNINFLSSLSTPSIYSFLLASSHVVSMTGLEPTTHETNHGSSMNLHSTSRNKLIGMHQYFLQNKKKQKQKNKYKIKTKNNYI